MEYEDEINEEINRLDGINEELPDNVDFIPDNEIFSVDELSNWVMGATSLLNSIDEYKENVSNKRRETDWRLVDILHRLENNIDDMTIYGMISVILELHKLRKIRRTLMVSDTAIYDFQKNTNRLNNINNRNMVDASFMKSVKNLTKPYRNRVYTEEQLNKMFCATSLSEENINELKQFKINIVPQSNITIEEKPKKRRGRPPKNPTSIE